MPVVNRKCLKLGMAGLAFCLLWGCSFPRGQRPGKPPDSQEGEAVAESQAATAQQRLQEDSQAPKGPAKRGQGEGQAQQEAGNKRSTGFWKTAIFRCPPAMTPGKKGG